MSPRYILSLAVLLIAATASAQGTREQIGGIRFSTDLDKALAESAKDGRPVIAYFTFDT